MKKKIFTLVTLALLSIGSAWGAIGDTFTVTFNGSDAQTTAGYFTFGGNHNFNGKFTGATYDNVTYTSGLKMESTSEIYWTAEAEHTVIILQSTWSEKTNKLDGNTLETSTATAGTGYRLYTVEKVAAGSHTISRGSGENGLFMVRVVYTGESTTVVAVPTITWNSSTNKASITCKTTGATIYYTTDGSEPTASSSVYSAEIPLTNSTTVRAIAIKNETPSAIAKADCYVTHPSALAVLGYSGGSVSGDIWTSTDGNYILTNNVAGRGINYASLAGSQDGFKLNHVDSYTLKVSDNVKVTKIVVVGKTWLGGNADNASTIAFDRFTPESGSFYDYPTDGETYVKTLEFTPESGLGYGATITMRPGNNQLGAYIEIYGEEYAKTVTTTTFETTTWDFTNWSDATKTGVKADETNWNPHEKAGNGGINFGDNGRSLAISRSNNSLSYGDPGTKIAETDGLKFNTNEKTYQLALIFDMKEVDGMSPTGGYNSAQYMWLYGGDAIINIENVTKGSIIEIGLETHKKENGRGLTLTNSKQTQGDAKPTAYQVCKWEVTSTGTVTITPNNGGLHIYYIKLDKAVETEAVAFTPVYDKTTFVTPKALDFTGVEGLKAYVATGTNSNGVKISEVTAPVPAGTPLLLIGTANTEYTVPAVAETEATAPAPNLLVAGNGTTVFDGTTYDYILYSDGKFYQIGSGTVATTKAYLHLDLDQAPSTRSLAITFDDETNGISDTLKENEEMMTDKVFDLQGRRVANPTKGLYIVGGKKVIVK